ncbi:MAG: GH3 auxin-responsive promoter family protein [Gammaproteobacteria bacterium]
MLTALTHRALRVACWQADRRFSGQLDQLERVQRHKLDILLQRTSHLSGLMQGRRWEDFRERQPLSRYGDWKERIQRQREGGGQLVNSPVHRYQPTSGSSEALKLIPYTQAFLGELDAAIGPWLASLYRRHPGISSGRHYWSVSWLPESQRQLLDGNFNDDSELLGVAKRVLAAHSQAVPPGVAFAGGADDAMFATLAWLVAHDDLRMLSVWSPTFALQQLDCLAQWAGELSQVLATGHWGSRSGSLAKVPAPHRQDRARRLGDLAGLAPAQLAQRLWPDLALVSAWDTADAAPWAAQLRLALPQAAFEGKGLWATEGVVTIPYQGCYPLAYQSHVYEFERTVDGNILAPWELREGDEVSPVISGGNGLLRYRLDDRLVVTGFLGRVPCFQFLGRRFGVDLVGEKMSPEAARQVLAEAALQAGVEPVSVLAVDARGQGRSRYVALFGRGASGLEPGPDEPLAELVDRGLRRHFHYDLARDLHQLDRAAAMVVDDGWALYQAIAMATGMIEGNIKPESIRRVPLSALVDTLPGAMPFFATDARVPS